MGARFSAPVQSDPEAHPASCTMGTRSFPGVKSGQVVTLTPHPLLVPWSWKGTAIPLLLLWAVRPVQRLSVCTRVNFTYVLTAEVNGLDQHKRKYWNSRITLAYILSEQVTCTDVQQLKFMLTSSEDNIGQNHKKKTSENVDGCNSWEKGDR